MITFMMKKFNQDNGLEYVFKILRCLVSFCGQELPISFVSKVKETDKVDGPDVDKSEWKKLEILIAQTHSSKLMTVIQPPEVQWKVNLLQLKLGYACDIFTPIPGFNIKKQMYSSWKFHVDDCYE
jgi:hypothetical protein